MRALTLRQLGTELICFVVSILRLKSTHLLWAQGYKLRIVHAGGLTPSHFPGSQCLRVNLLWIEAFLLLRNNRLFIYLKKPLILTINLINFRRTKQHVTHSWIHPWAIRTIYIQHNQLQRCWCPDNVWSQGITSRGIDLILSKSSSLNPTRRAIFLSLTVQVTEVLPKGGSASNGLDRFAWVIYISFPASGRVWPSNNRLLSYVTIADHLFGNR